MDRKIKLLAASSLVAVLASGCAPYNTQTGTYDNSYSGYGGGASQNAGASQNTRVATNTNTCAACNAKKKTYKYVPPRNTGEHTQQWYINRWNRQQQQQQQYRPPAKTYRPPAKTYRPPVKTYRPPAKTYRPPAKTYGGYGGAKQSKNSYYDYSKAGGYGGAKQSKNSYYDYSKAGGYSTSNKNIYTGSSTSNSASNKSIYTGNYSNNTYKPYSPKTYTSGANSNTYVAPSGGSNNAGYSSSYGGGEVATGAYKAGDSSYTVKKGDTVFSVMRLTGVYWKDIIKKNNLQKPSYTISPGQRLRLK